MDHNESIECIVNECKYHCNDDNYCTLNKIRVQKHGAAAQSIECTDCGNFKKR